jgi:hypothetical protein
MSPNEGRVADVMERGVVTLCDSKYYPGLLQLHASIQTSDPCYVICYDAGLTPAQRRDADRRENLRVLTSRTIL